MTPSMHLCFCFVRSLSQDDSVVPGTHRRCLSANRIRASPHGRIHILLSSQKQQQSWLCSPRWQALSPFCRLDSHTLDSQSWTNKKWLPFFTLKCISFSIILYVNPNFPFWSHSWSLLYSGCRTPGELITNVLSFTLQGLFWQWVILGILLWAFQTMKRCCL